MDKVNPSPNVVLLGHFTVTHSVAGMQLDYCKRVLGGVTVVGQASATKKCTKCCQSHHLHQK